MAFRYLRDHLLNGERLRVDFSMDCCDCEVMSYMARYLMEQSIEDPFGQVDTLPHPVQWLSDNGPAYIAHKARSFARMIGIELCTSSHRNPEYNGMTELFVETFKLDYVQLSSCMMLIVYAAAKSVKRSLENLKELGRLSGKRSCSIYHKFRIFFPLKNTRIASNEKS